MSKVWIVIGASTGFGRAIATAAPHRGYVAVATARNRDDVADIEHHDHLDVTNARQVEQVVDAEVKRHGRIDVAVNNAGHGLVGVTEEVTYSDLYALLETNLLGVWRVTRAALPHLRRQGSGSFRCHRWAGLSATRDTPPTPAPSSPSTACPRHWPVRSPRSVSV